MMNRTHLRLIVLTGATTLLVGALVSCGSTQTVAPEIDGLLLRMAESEGHSAASMRLGRKLYMSDCAKCHTPEPIGQYGLAEWPGILDDMIEQTPTIDAREAAALRAYVMTSRRSLP